MGQTSSREDAADFFAAAGTMAPPPPKSAPAPPAAPRWKFANAYDAQVRSFDEDSDLEIVSLAESPEAGLALVEQAAAPVEAAAPKSRKRGRPRKVPPAAPPPKTAEGEAAAPERKRGRPRKVVAAPSPLGSEPEAHWPSALCWPRLGVRRLGRS